MCNATTEKRWQSVSNASGNRRPFGHLYYWFISRKTFRSTVTKFQQEMRLTKIMRFAVELKAGGILPLDHLRITVKGGTGGSGLGDYGGVGGEGGDVYLIANKKQSLLQFSRDHPRLSFTAKVGSHSRKLCLVGEKGKDLLIPVPVGITVQTDEGKLIGELNEHGQRMLVAQGGEGGSAKTDFLPLQGTRIAIRLDLKLIADIGLYPNAGKSTLLKAISNAEPKIASYPFTTVKPQVGIIEYADFRRISVADLPGLIEGAHKNVGMGYEFLKHVERTRLLLLMVDVHGFQLKAGAPFRNPLETLLSLNKEIELYDQELLRKPTILCLNKIDSAEGRAKVPQILEQIKNLRELVDTVPEELRPTKLMKFCEILPISAKMNSSVDELKQLVRDALDQFDDAARLKSTTKRTAVAKPIENSSELDGHLV